MYYYIIEMTNEKVLNPKTNRMVSINSKLGRKLKKDEELHVLVDAIIPLKEIDSITPVEEVINVIDEVNVIDVIDEVNVIDVIDVIDVNEEDVKKFEEATNEVNEVDVKKFEEATNEVNEVDVFKVIMDKKEYMKKYYEANRDKIIDRTRSRYKLNRNITEKKEPVLDKKDYMKTYYRQNKDKIKERSHNRYKIKKEISVFTDKINERLE